MRTETVLDRLSHATHAQWFGIAFLLLRIGVGLEFFYAGITKFGDWTAAGYLASANGPFAAWFQSLAGNAFIDALNAAGLTLIGVALLLGLCTRPAAIAGIVTMLLYYLAHFVDNTEHGYIDQHIVLVLVFLMFAAGGAGHAFGLNGMVMDAMRRPNAFMRFLFG
ncbi:DoxX family protein [Candidatus Uhrbacteria bacterium]|nr:DoxX family protein [Candidatus Uhrbacteria bacterium]